MMDKVAHNSLRVQWTMSVPPVAPKNWQHWDLDSINNLEHPETTRKIDAGDEVSLAWPLGSIGILRRAFALGLGRSTGWEESAEIEPNLTEHGGVSGPLFFAARVFKRGVGYRRQNKNVGLIKPLYGSYNIDIFDKIEDLSWESNNTWLIVDQNVADAWSSKIPSLLELFMPSSGTKALAPMFLLLDEHLKTLTSVGKILSAWRGQGSPQVWTIIGGGVLGDVAAFAAGLVGCKITLIPTTLVAMADACLGGKTGVNFFPYGKNQVGLFYFPEQVLVCSEWLESLPSRELVAGGAECLKHGLLIGDQQLLMRLATAIKSRNLASLQRDLPKVIALKAQVVHADPAEQGERAILNLGHTMGHALESVSQAMTTGETTLLHGEAVGLGLIFALLLSRRVAGLSQASFELMTQALQTSDCMMGRQVLSQRLGGLDLDDELLWDKIINSIKFDKKNDQEGIQWVLLKDFGQVLRQGASWTIPVKMHIIKEVWREFVNFLP